MFSKYLTSMCLLLMMSPVASADSNELENLARIMRELKVVKAVVQKAQEEVVAEDNVLNFRYDLLNDDISAMEQAIEEHINSVQRLPRFKRLKSMGTS